jgi:hypothetical protein
VVPGNFSESLLLDLPSGNLHAQWGRTAERPRHPGAKHCHQCGEYSLTTLAYAIDLTLRIKRI